MMRALKLWSPAAATLGMAFYIWTFGHDDTSVVIFLFVITFCILAHTCQLVQDHRRLHKWRH